MKKCQNCDGEGCWEDGNGALWKCSICDGAGEIEECLLGVYKR